MSRRSPRKLTPTVFRLESREVPTVISPLAYGRHGLASIVHAAAAGGGSAGASGAGSTAAAGSNATLLGVGSPSYFDPARLTPLGIAKSTFAANSKGPYNVGGSLYNGFTKVVEFIGPVNSNLFSKATLYGKIHVPAAPIPFDPTNPGAIQASGFLALRNRNVSNTGTELILDVQVTRLDGAGRPTQLYWQVDAGSGGSFGGAAGQGTIDIAYNRNGHSKNSAGGATMIYHGLVVTTGVTDITAYDTPHFN